MFLILFLVESMDISSEFPKYYRPVSLRLYQLLEDVGATVEMREHMMETCTTREIMRTIALQPELTVYIFGSSYEGTTLKEMCGDLDEVGISNNLKVITEISEDPGTGLLLVQDDATPAGYCKLQLVHDGIPSYGVPSREGDQVFADAYCKNLLTLCTDNNNRTVCSFKPSAYISQKPYLKRHGPALSVAQSETCSGKDIVWALQCNKWPDSASEWLSRRRFFNWPTKDMVDKCKTMGCIFVAVGHPLNAEHHLQWRISLSHQERFLLTRFNSVQLKCYIVLKLIKNEMILPHVPDSLSSYHIKTCLLCLIEDTPCSLWKPENLLCCVVICLRRILQCVECGVCPNYFIPAENMFERRVYGETRIRLYRVLQHLLSADCKFMGGIQTERLGDLLCFSFLAVNFVRKSYYRRAVADYFGHRKVTYCIHAVITCFKSYHTCLWNSYNEDLEKCLESMYMSVSKLKQTETLPEHTNIETERSISLLLPFIEVSYLSNLIAKAVKQRKPNDQIYAYLVSEQWQEVRLTPNSFCSRLKQASHLYMLEYYHEALTVLTTLQNRKTFTACFCYGPSSKYVLPDVRPLLDATQGIPTITTENLLKYAIIPCVCFLPTEKDITPPALHYEMIRTVGTLSCTSTDEIEHIDKYYSEWVFIDGQFLLYFLLYLNHHKLNMESLTAADIASMELVVNTENVSHRETCLNLLGWVYKEEKNIERAAECFRLSLETKPVCNAAFWHMKDLENMADV